MIRLSRLLVRDRLILSVAGLLALAGIIALTSMPRQEDPSFPYRQGIVSAALPGADADTVARLVARPLEREIAQVEGVEQIISRARQDVAIINITLEDSIYATDAVWTRVRAALDRAQPALPPGARPPVLDDRVIGAELAVYGVVGGTVMQRRDAALRLRDRLAMVPGVATSRLSGDPGESVAVTMEPTALAALGLDLQGAAAAIASRGSPSLTGALQADGRSLPLQLDVDYTSLQAIAAVPLPLPGGSVVPLGAIATVQRGTAMPAQQRAYVNGEPTIAVEIKAQRDGVNVIVLGRELRRHIAEFNQEIAPLAVREIFYQPFYTDQRLRQLIGSLLTSMGLILAVLCVALGIRPALVVAAILPLVTTATLAIYAMGGGVLQQIVVVGMVVALGILVDNAIVIVEGIQRRLDEGESVRDAMLQAVQELAAPLLAATGTTLAAFLPLLLSTGNAADFTRGVPIAITISLIVSYAFAVLVTPLLAATFLRRRKRQGPKRSDRVANFAVYLLQHHPRASFCGGLLVLALSLACFPYLQLQFFPYADRPAILVELQMPAGTHPDTTDAVSAQVEAVLRTQPDVGTIHRFVGYAGPAFYYNLQRSPSDPARARLLVETAGLEHNRELVRWIDDWAAAELPGVEVIPMILRQGPPTSAPIEVLVYHSDRSALVEAVQEVVRIARATEGTRGIRHSLGQGVPAVAVNLLGGWTELAGVRVPPLADLLAASSQGLTVGTYRAGEEPVPIRLHLAPDQNTPSGTLAGLPVPALSGTVPLAQVARLGLDMRPGLVERRDQQQVATVSAEAITGYGVGNVLNALRAQIAQAQFPTGTRIQYLGEAEASGKANTAIVRAAPLGLLVFLFFVLVQFNSLRRALLVLSALPFALTGVFPALLLAGLAFGFNSLQGVIALIGITVNNTILLLSAADDRLAQGSDVDSAIADAVQRRLRPILLTTATTITGLLPLVFSSSTLWPPLAWAMIGGLAGSALLSLTALPVMARFVLRRTERARHRDDTDMTAGAAIAG